MKISKDLPPNYPDILKAIPEIENTSDSLAHDLISPIYGATITHNEAVSKIRNYGKEKKN